MEQSNDDANQISQNQIESLTKQNQELKVQCASYEAELARMRSDARSKQEFMNKVDDLSHRICRIIEEKKKEEIKFTESQQYDRNFFNQKILELSADLQVATESINDLKAIIHQQDQENKYGVCQLNCEIEKLKNADRNVLAAAGNYFHTYFPSIKSLQEHCESNPIVKRPAPKPQPFNPNYDCEITHQNDIKKMKKQISKIHSLKEKNEELQESMVNLESLNQTLEKDNEHLKRELTQLKMNQLNSPPKSPKRKPKTDDSKCIKLELEKANQKIKELEQALQENQMKNAEKEADHRTELAQIQFQIEIEAEKGQKASELKQKLKESKSIIDNQKGDINETKTKINQLTDIQSQQVVQIAKLEAENQKKKDKIKELKSKLKAIREVPARIEVQPEILWDSVTSPDIPGELQKSLTEIIENKLLPIESKMKLAFKTICAYYTANQQNLEQFQSKYKSKYSKCQKSLSNLVSQIGVITLNRAISFDEVYESLSIQTDILTAIKKFVTKIKELESHIRIMEANFPYDLLTSLKVDLKEKTFELNELKSQNKQLKKQMIKRQSSLSFTNFEIFTSDNDSNLLHNKIKEQAAQLNEIEYQITVANNVKSSAEKKLDLEKKNFNDTRGKLFICQKEIEKLKKVISEKETIITDLQTKIRNKSFEELNNRVQKADNEREFLINEITSIRNEHSSKAEYENIIHQLQVKIQLLEKELQDIQNGKSGINQLNDQLRKVEHERLIAKDEIQILRDQGSVVVPPNVKQVEDKKLEIIQSLKEELSSSEKKCQKLERRLTKMQKIIEETETSNEMSQRIAELEKVIAKLEKQIEDERESYIKQLKEARLEKIKEYQALVDQLKNRCKIQTNTIEALSNKLKYYNDTN